MAIISSYPLATPNFGDQIIGTNAVDSLGYAIAGTPTVQYNFTSIKTLVDQQFITQITANDTRALQGPATTNTNYKIGFNNVTNISNVNAVLTQADTDSKLTFLTTGTYRVQIQYMVGITNTANTPFLLFRTLQDGLAAAGETISYFPGYSNLSSRAKEPLSIDIIVNITTVNTFYEFEMLRDSGGANDGSLQQILNNQASWTNTPNASIIIQKLI